MTSKQDQNNPMDKALSEFYDKWTKGLNPDPDEFCKKHKELCPALKEQIDDFLLVAKKLPYAEQLDLLPKITDISHKPGATLGDFKIIRLIGGGGMGKVYEAEQLSLKRRVALKVLPSHLSFSDEVVQKFKREAEAGGRQSHPNIVAIHGVGEDQGIHYIAQEYIEGGRSLSHKLDETLQKKDKKPQGYYREVAGFVAEVADALQHAHESGVIHRDIKPSNILLTREGKPKVSDFGLARVEDALSLSRTGDLAGTPYYMSPEQAMSKRIEIDMRTDVYSLGVTLYEMLTLKRPFEGNTSQEILKKILVNDPMDPQEQTPGAPRDLSVICLKAMEKNPQHRFQSMKDFKDDLNRFLSNDVILAKPASLGNKLWKKVKRNPVKSVMVCAALTTIVSIIGYIIFISYPKIKAAEKEAQSQRHIAEERAKEIQQNYNEIMRLSLILELSRLEEEAEMLWPAFPENAPKLQKWLVRADASISQLEEHRRALVALRKIALVSNSTPPAWEFEDIETQWRHNMLADLVSGLEKLSSKDSGAYQSVRERLQDALTIKEKSVVAHQGAWDKAIASIKNIKECPKYNGLTIDPIVGMTPIGRDPSSGLWEFVYLPTGEIPKRNKDGALALMESMGLIFVLIPGGDFNMGAVTPSKETPFGGPNVDPNAHFSEKPVHGVSLMPFFISKYEMTQGQWLRFTKRNPSMYHPNVINKDIKISHLHPVERVSWNDCTQVLWKLKLRLPSEAEWEYAARAGTSSIWWTGNKKESLIGAANLVDLHCKTHGGNPQWYYEEWLNDGFTAHGPVGSFRSNAFGLHDVHGNVFEWCEDVYDSYENTPRDGSAHKTGSSHWVMRGGGWGASAKTARISQRTHHNADYQFFSLGVRPAMSLP